MLNRRIAELERQLAAALARVVERTHAWLHQFHRLRVRYERRADIHEAILILGCGICGGTLQPTLCQMF